MRILGLYAQKSLPLMRRVLAPFSVLYTRNHPFSFQQAPTFNPGLGVGYDVTVLHQWILSDEENEELKEAVLSRYQVFVYDLADPALLQSPEVRTTLAYCRMITVPNEYLKKEVRIAISGAKVEVLPSCLDIPYLSTGQKTAPKEKERYVGCFGTFDWTMVEGALMKLKEEKPNLVFLGDSGAHAVLGDLVQEVVVDADSYPSLLKGCLAGLCPLEKMDGRDVSIVRHEWGYFGKPSSHFLSPPEGRTDRILKWMKAVTTTGSDLFHAHDLIEEAKQQRSTLIADQYLRAYRKMLPHIR